MNKLPVVSAIAKSIYDHYKGLLLAYEQEMAGDFSGLSSTRVFVLRELLMFASLLDYSDQFGRQQMDPLISEWFIVPSVVDLSTCRLERLLEEDQLPLPLVPPCLDILRKLAPNEYGFIKTVVEIVKSIRESIEDEIYFVRRIPHSQLSVLTVALAGHRGPR